MKMKEEYTLKHIMKRYNLDKYVDKDIILNITENVKALSDAYDVMVDRRDYTGVIASDVLLTEIYKHERFLRRLRNNHPEYFV